MKTMPVPTTEGRAACADPQHLPLVDAAFAKPGGPEAQQMKLTLCRDCPVAQTCFTWAMTHAEAGVWGATSPKLRTMHGAPNKLAVVPDYLHRERPEGVRPPGRRGPDTKPRRPQASAIRCAELGVTERDVRRWAHEHGLARSNKGRPSLAHVEAWAAAHRAA